MCILLCILHTIGLRFYIRSWHLGVNRAKRKTLILLKIFRFCNNKKKGHPYQQRSKMSTESPTDQSTQSPQPIFPIQPLLITWEAEADALDLQGERRTLFRLLRGFHEFSLEQCETLREEGYSRLSHLYNWRHNDIRSLLENLSNRPVTRGGRRYGDRKIKELQALSWFLTDRRRRGLSQDLELYCQQADYYISLAETDFLNSKRESTVTKPGKFKYSEWNQWEESVYLYLNSIRSDCGAPLSYVIRKDLDEDIEWDSLDREVQKIHAAPLEGFMFNLDSKQVLSLLKELCLNTGAETWFRNIKCGRLAMKALQKHYDGPDERHKRIEEARAKISQTFYKHEGTFTFEKFTTILQDAFAILEKYGEPVYEREKLKMLFSKSLNNHPDFKQEINICRQHYHTFEEAITYLKTVVSRLFLEAPKSKPRRNISSVTAKEVNGVDISDLTRWYDSGEIKKLNESQAGRRVLSKIMSDKKRHQRHKEKIDKIKSNKKRRVKSVTSKPQDDKSVLSEQDKRVVAAVITGMNNSTRHNNSNASMSGRVIRTNINSVSADSAITYDHLGNPL